MIPVLVSNKNSNHEESYYQITNISDDYRYFDFLGVRVSMDNKEAAEIIRDRIHSDYYDNLDYDITPEDLDRFDRECVIHGEMLLKYPLETPEQIIPTRPYPLRALSWIELDRLARGEDDMTLTEVNQLLKEVYNIDLTTVQKDKQILERHKELQELQESEEMIEGNTFEILVEYDDDLIKEFEPYAEAYKLDVIRLCGNLDDEHNYMSMSELIDKIFYRKLETKEIEDLKRYIIEISKILKISPRFNKVYKGVLAVVVVIGTSYGKIKSDYTTMESIVNLS